MLEALYSCHSALLPLLHGEPESYIQTVSQILHSQTTTPGRNLIRAHITFIASHFYASVTSLPDAGRLTALIFERVFFPLLLFSKPRQRTAALAWEIIEGTEKSAQGAAILSRYQLLGGCVEAIRWEESKHQSTDTGGGDSYHGTEGLAKINITIAAKVAGTFSLCHMQSHTSDRAQRKHRSIGLFLVAF